MKLERLSEYVLPGLALGGGLLFAVFAGALTGGGDTSRLAMVFFAIIAIACVVALNRHVWLLIPPTWFLIGRISLLPIPFNIREVVIIGVTVSVLALIAVKIVRRRPQYGWLDFLLLLNVLYLASCFARNPVGFNAANSAIVGGRPYFEVVVSLLAYWVLMRMQLTVRLAYIAPLLCLVSTGIIAGFSLLLLAVPSLFPVFVSFYTGFDPSSYLANDVTRGASGLGRVTGLQDLGRQGGIVLCSLFPPATLLLPLYFGRFLGFAVISTALLLSGFRSEIVYCGAMFFLSAHFRGGIQGMIPPMILGVVLILVLVAGQGTIYQLPMSAQRALSFLPGRWANTAVDSGRGSTEWRMEIWKTVLSSDRYIHNKFWGDGFGIDRRDFNSIGQMGGIQTDTMSQEVAMISSDYHSGPISTLKFVGVPGLVLFYSLMISMARAAIRLIHRARETPYFVFALFVGMPIIFKPIWFTLIFGGFNSDMPEVIFALGMLKLTQARLDEHFASATTSPVPLYQAQGHPARRVQRPMLSVPPRG